MTAIPDIGNPDAGRHRIRSTALEGPGRTRGGPGRSGRRPAEFTLPTSRRPAELLGRQAVSPHRPIPVY